VQSFAQSQYRDKKINTRKLVDDYWTPSAKKYSLIQQRYFVKSNRPMISFGGGVHVNNPQHEGFMTQLSAGYFLSEKWGFEAQYTKSMLNGNDVIKQLDSLSGGSSTLDRTKTLDYVGGAILYSPIYGKMSLLGYKILYYDLILSGQLGQTQYQQTQSSNSTTASAPTFGIGITQLFYLNKHISLRVDFNNRWYNAEVLKYTDGSKVKDRTINDTQLSLGLSFML
jgi:outer membrane beta-barrel protein